ncbi:hypothetical protein FA09DRAFT_124540 [Tilletiopsis washingtonensis]|uniref:Uncharacterized protein n=1 Tax=Tilletiopsis washingtonensis TaxID=58919 RepID=A0A316Z6A2_9BASI|nr:hypothetical protein FA09DRAFT_124540 [Tilletiopsis washingtonensis]PWN95745.1 hypothetical protein FA09DRAFT_124540 [Tilletiopsis washingtonensis]
MKAQRRAEDGRRQRARSCLRSCVILAKGPSPLLTCSRPASCICTCRCRRTQHATSCARLSHSGLHSEPRCSLLDGSAPQHADGSRSRLAALTSYVLSSSPCACRTRSSLALLRQPSAMPTTLRRLFRERGPGRSHCHTPTDGAVGAKTQASSPPNDRPDFTSIEDKAPPQQQLLQDSVYVPDSRAASLLRSSSKPTTWRQRLLRVSSTRRSGASPPETAAARTERTRARLQSAPDQPVPRAEQPRTPLTPGRKRASTDATPSLKRSVSARSDERRARPGDALPRHDKHSRAVGRQASDPFAALPMLPAWQTDARVPSLRGDESFLRCASSPRTTSPVVSPSIARVIHRDYAFPSMPAPDHGEDGAPPPPGVDAEWDEVRGQAQAKIASWRAVSPAVGASRAKARTCANPSHSACKRAAPSPRPNHAPSASACFRR